MIRETGACFRGQAPARGQLLAGELDKSDRTKVFAALVKNPEEARRRVARCCLLLAAFLPLAGNSGAGLRSKDLLSSTGRRKPQGRGCRLAATHAMLRLSD